MPSENPVCTGLAERIGIEGSYVKHTVFEDGEKRSVEVPGDLPDHAAGLKVVMELLTEGEYAVISSPDDIAAVGHRVVHGGEYFSGATLITGQVKSQIKSLFSLAPLHNAVSYTCIEVAEQTFPKAKQIAVFDTSFHQTLPDYAYRYAIPKTLYREQGIRVYGFHGTSHKYVSAAAARYLGNPDAKIISIHLGNGCSMAAIKGGVSLDTSMGFGPLSGLMMGTRSGDIDPSVVFHLLNQDGNTPAGVNNLLNKGSGLLGVGGSNDMRDVHKFAEAGDEEAQLALELYAYRIKKFIGAYAAVLNGVDAVLFTAGVGENDSRMRASVCTGLEFLNLHLDEEKNKTYQGEILEINTAASAVKVLVVPTNEEREIAAQCYEQLK